MDRFRAVTFAELHREIARRDRRVAELEAALRGLLDVHFPTKRVIHESSFEHVRREASLVNARAVLATRPAASRSIGRFR